MWIEIFKSGEHKDSSGNTHNYSNEDLSDIVNLYNDKIRLDSTRTAPLVKGHPKDNEPAYGWVEKLTKRGNTLLAKLKDVKLDTINEIREGKFKNVSISLYPDLNLRHVGLLGAVPPAVKGLSAISFNDMELNVEFTDNNNISESERLKQEIELLKREKRLNEHRYFAESLIDVKSGASIPPSMKSDIIDLLEYSSKLDYEYQSDSESKLLDKFKCFFSNLKPFLSFNEYNFQNQEVVNQFANKQNIDSQKLNLHNSAMKLINQSNDLSYEEAILQIQKNSFQ